MAMRLVCLIVLLVLGAECQAQVADTADWDSLDVTEPSIPHEHDPIAKDGNPLNDEATIKIQREEVPLFLQKILKDEKFRGWESGGVYRNDQLTLFKVEVRDGMNNRTFYFDQEGNVIRAN